MPSFQQAHTSMFWDMDELCKDQVLFTRKNRHKYYENFGMIEIQLPEKYKENFDVSKVLHICTYQAVVFLYQSEALLLLPLPTLARTPSRI